MTKNIIKSKNIFSLSKLILLMAFLLFGISCNTDFDRVLTEDYPQSGTKFESGKVMYIILDGASGAAMRTALYNGKAPNLLSMLSNASYSFNSLADLGGGTMTNERGWANLLTGVGAAQHGVEASDLSHLQAPTVLSLLNGTGVGIQSSIVTADSAFYGAFSSDANSAAIVLDDSFVKDKCIEELDKEGTTVSDVVLAHFNGIELAGRSSGYFDPDTDGPESAVIDAVQTIDDYIGDIMGQLKARPNYSRENWLVIVVSSYGGVLSASNSDLYDDKSRNAFTLMFNSRFSSKLIQKPALEDSPYVGYGARYTYENDNYVNATLQDPTLFNMGADNSYTIQFMLKNTAGTYGWPTVLSKRKNGFSGLGWNIFLKGNYWTINTSKSGETAGATVSDGKWHVLTVVFEQFELGVHGTVKVYTDGIFNNENRLWNNSWDLMDNDIPLRIGRIPSDGDNRPDFLLTNLQIYNTAFSSEDISTLSCISDINESHPYFEDLVGYWPSDEIGGNIIKEKTRKWGSRADFGLTGPYTWKDFSDNSTNICPPAPGSYYRLVPNSIDMPFQILQWLGISSNTAWNLEGRGWAPTYSILN
jgi:hypothetical protein